MADTNTKPTLSSPKDESLESFKAWIIELSERLTGVSGDDGSISEDEWKTMWEDFWKK